MSRALESKMAASMPHTDVATATEGLEPATWTEVRNRVIATGQVVSKLMLPMMDAAATYAHYREPDVPRWVVASLRRGGRVMWFLGAIES